MGTVGPLGEFIARLFYLHAPLGLVSIGVGVYHGYCDGNGFPVDNENLLSYGTMIAGGIGGGLIGASDAEKSLDSVLFCSAFAGVPSTVLQGGITLAAYGVGYTAAKLF